jgi:photosystem II stability/assembly factor-like uncharacterized protein
MLFLKRLNLCAACVAGLIVASATLSTAQDLDDTLINFGDGAQWKCLGGQWTSKGEVGITPPDDPNLHSRAFYVARSFSDFTAEFEYNATYGPLGHGDAGLILRAQDGGHFYFVHFPWGGQSLRAKNYWGGIAKVSGDGYLRHIVYEDVPGVPSEVSRWFKVKVVAKGPSIRVWVNGRVAFEAHDETYRSGYIGLAGQGGYRFRNLRITGTATAPPAWDDNVRIHEPAFELPINSRTMPSGCVAPNGDILIGSGGELLRSTDKGRTWTRELFPARIHGVTDSGDTMFCDSKGRLLIFLWQKREDEQKTPSILISESMDSGKTWTHPVASRVAEGWPEDPATLGVFGPLCETADGTLLRFMLGGVNTQGQTYGDVRTWGAYSGAKGYCIRSTDGGKTWSAPIDLDWPSWNGKKPGDFPGSLDFTETTGIAIGNTVMVTVRPVYSTQMWQCWSYDAGKTWDAAVRTTFPGYAQSMLRTASGAILVAHRNPNYSVNVSRDDGINWDAGTVIDYPAWAMGCMIEVEPDVVLIVYMNAIRGDPMLAQRVRITAAGIEPLGIDE